MAKKIPLLTPAAGQVIGLKKVDDQVFSSGMMGQGFGLEPSSGQVVAPVDGEVAMVAEAKHAIGFTTSDGLEVLVHMGINTVEMKGAPFEIKVKAGDKVVAGQAIATMDLTKVKEAGFATTIVTLVTNVQDVLEGLDIEEKTVEAGTPVATAYLKKATKKGGKLDYDALATTIIENVGGKENVNGLIHCITRLRFYLKDESKAHDGRLARHPGGHRHHARRRPVPSCDRQRGHQRVRRRAQADTGIG